MAIEHDHVCDAAMSLDEAVAGKPIKQGIELNPDAKSIPEDATEVPDFRDINAQRDPK
jgi:hypothetical protein